MKHSCWHFGLRWWIVALVALMVSGTDLKGQSLVATGPRPADQAAAPPSVPATEFSPTRLGASSGLPMDHVLNSTLESHLRAQDGGSDFPWSLVLLMTGAGAGLGYLSCSSEEARETKALCEETLEASVTAWALVWGGSALIMKLAFDARGPSEFGRVSLTTAPYPQAIGVGLRIAF